MSRFHAFSPEDFEELTADLLSAQAGAPYEIFARGRDRGIDLRRRHDDGRLEIVRVKHYERSTFAALRTAAGAEQVKLTDLEEQPDMYRFVTSQELTVSRKAELLTALAPFITDASQIIGQTEVELLLRQHSQVERAHPKLWLTGSTQLADMVHADVRDRSAALLADIAEAIPTYVRHSRFVDAQERLHQGRVLILAGDPGVGKTTLANMLVADALSQGFDEPVAVSRHTDEVRRVLDPSRKQIIVYDDFLGRTALDRLDKNQDRDLTGLMRQVLRAPHTLFILTTREYILRHATQLHEELRHGGVEERRFLLHLRHYSLHDRARIFLNHAYQSTSMPAGAARELLANEGYLRILGHSNYNPRTIAYITGMAGPTLDFGDAESYLEFALQTLDDPARLWRQTFRHEVGSAERALLLALTVGPSDVAAEDLGRLYSAVAPHVGAESGEEAFDDALRTLDDSMLRTYHDEGVLFVTGRDPSVEDYLKAHVSSHPEHALALLDAAQAFEHVSRLVRDFNVARWPGAAPRIATAVQRTYEARAVGWHAVSWGEDTELTTTRDERSLPRRLLVIHGFMQRVPLLEPLLRPWWTEHLGSLLLGLSSEQRNQRRDVLALVKTVRGSIAAIEGADRALVTFMTDGLHHDQHWDALLELRGAWPQVFTGDRWQELRAECESWLLSSLNDADDLRDVEELDEIVRVAEKMGLTIDVDLLEETRDLVRTAHGSRDDEPEYEPPDDEPDDVEDTEAERAQIHECFVRFAEQVR